MTSAFSLTAADGPSLRVETESSPFWLEFRGRIVRAVQEYNMVAGEKVWSVREPAAGNRCGLEISGDFSTARRLRLGLDSQRKRLSCVFFLAGRKHSWSFDVLPGRILRRCGKLYRLEQAADRVLDHLAPV